MLLVEGLGPGRERGLARQLRVQAHERALDRLPVARVVRDDHAHEDHREDQAGPPERAVQPRDVVVVIDRFGGGLDDSAGGGTRIKALEAFAYWLPVIATRIGLEGIAAQHGEHALIADSPVQFAEYCALIAQDAGLRRRLSENAYQLVQEHYSPTVLRQSLAKAWGDHENKPTAANGKGFSAQAGVLAVLENKV